MARFQLPPSIRQNRNYVDGRFVQTAKTFDNICPVDGTVLGQVYEADQALVDQAVAAARKAVSSTWGRLPVGQRADYLHRVADIIERRHDEFLAAEVADTGRPINQARSLDIYRGMHNFRTFAELGRHAHSEFYETHLGDGSELINSSMKAMYRAGTIHACRRSWAPVAAAIPRQVSVCLPNASACRARIR